MTNSGSLDGTTHYAHDRSGNVIAELNAAGATVREYIWLPEAEIAPTAASRAQIDRPIAVVDGVNATPANYYVHADHLHRPLRMTNAAKSIVWSAEYQPWGAVQSLSGALTLDLRFPGQWFQLEAGLHYNWHRHYDASLGRYTQPDPLGFVDGPSVYGYARHSPTNLFDPDGRIVPFIVYFVFRDMLFGAVIDLSLQWSWNYFVEKQTATQSLRCLNIISTIYSMYGSALGVWEVDAVRLIFGRMGSIERRLLYMLALSQVGSRLSPPLTLDRLLGVLIERDYKRNYDCYCSKGAR